MRSKEGIIIGAIALALIIISAILVLYIRRVFTRRRLRTAPRPDQTPRIPIMINGVKAFTYEEMAQATNNFCLAAQAGEGGYGKVYRGILVDGTMVAIKRAQEGSLQGEREFMTEIQLLSRLHHRNLVSLIGYCDEEGEQMLVYEFMTNGSLREHLSVPSREPPSFATRMRIALESAKGILYLHRDAIPPVFHRDVKSSNILLDSNFTAKVADFGLSKLAPMQGIQGAEATHVSTMPKGTLGYIDPEYFLTNQLTDKSDVYSLGVVFLELLTGMQAISHGRNIVREVKAARQSGSTSSVIDRRMGSYSPPERIMEFLDLSLKCCRQVPHERPNMETVVEELAKIWSMMPESVAWRAVSESSRSDYGAVFRSSSSSGYESAVEEQPRQLLEMIEE